MLPWVVELISIIEIYLLEILRSDNNSIHYGCTGGGQFIEEFQLRAAVKDPTRTWLFATLLNQILIFVIFVLIQMLLFMIIDFRNYYPCSEMLKHGLGSGQ